MCVCVCVCVCVYVCVCDVCVCVCVHALMSACVCVCAHVGEKIHAYVHACTNICVLLLNHKTNIFYTNMNKVIQSLLKQHTLQNERSPSFPDVQKIQSQGRSQKSTTYTATSLGNRPTWDAAMAPQPPAPLLSVFTPYSRTVHEKQS